MTVVRTKDNKGIRENEVLKCFLFMINLHKK